MKLLRHPVAAMILLATLIGLLIPVYRALETGYGITESDTKEVTLGTTGETSTGNILDQFENLRLINGISDISAAITKITTGSNVIDLLGGLAGVGLGTLKTVLGLITIPYDIVNIISVYYGADFPNLNGIVAMIVIYTGFILLSAYLRKDV